MNADYSYNTYNNLDGRKNRSLAIILTYVLVFFLAGTLVASLILALYVNLKGIDPKSLYDAEGNLINKDAELFVGSITNFSVYVIGLIIILILARPYLTMDWQRSRANRKKFFLFIGQGILIYYAGNIVSNLISEIIGLTGDSENQKTIVELIESKYVVWVLVTTIVFAPLVEEIVFRKALFEQLSRKTNYKPIHIIIISGLLFALIHFVIAIFDIILSGQGIKALFNELIYIIPYFISGIILGIIYEHSERNIYVPITIHVLNNAISALLILLLPELPI